MSFSSNKHLLEISFNGFKFFTILAVANFAKINSKKGLCPVGYTIYQLWTIMSRCIGPRLEFKLYSNWWHWPYRTDRTTGMYPHSRILSTLHSFQVKNIIIIPVWIQFQIELLGPAVRNSAGNIWKYTLPANEDLTNEYVVLKIYSSQAGSVLNTCNRWCNVNFGDVNVLFLMRQSTLA